MSAIRTSEPKRRLCSAGPDTTGNLGSECGLSAPLLTQAQRWPSSHSVPHFGMTPKRYQSGEKDITGRISKIGDRSVRTV